MSPNQDPPVVKIMDYSRYVFDQRKRTKDNKKKQKVVHLKEIKLRPAIAGNDYVHKLNQAKVFLEKGDKVKFSIKFRGREIVHSELGYNLLNRVIEDLKGVMQLEQQPTREGKALSMVAVPVVGSKKKKKKEHEAEDVHEAEEVLAAEEADVIDDDDDDIEEAEE